MDRQQRTMNEDTEDGIMANAKQANTSKSYLLNWYFICFFAQHQIQVGEIYLLE